MASYSITKSANAVLDASGVWINKDNVKESDGKYATTYSPNPYNHRSLDLYDFGFNIPATATITGIQYSVKWKTSTKYSACYLLGEIFKNNVIVGSELWDATAPLTDKVVIRSNSSNGLTPTIVNSPDKNVFRIYLQVQHGNSKVAFTAYIEYVSVTILYDYSGTIEPPAPLTLTATQVDDYIKLTWD